MDLGDKKSWMTLSELLESVTESHLQNENSNITLSGYHQIMQHFKSEGYVNWKWLKQIYGILKAQEFLSFSVGQIEIVKCSLWGKESSNCGGRRAVTAVWRLASLDAVYATCDPRGHIQNILLIRVMMTGYGDHEL